MDKTVLLKLVHKKILLKQNLSGFTLLELLIVVVIFGIFTAMALPVFFSQVGKAREAEILGILGAISRSQQAYHWENGEFASTIQQLTYGTSSGFPVKYHTLTQDVFTNTVVTYKAEAIDLNQNVRNFALGVYFDVGTYGAAICQSSDVGVAVDVGGSVADNCTNGGKRLK